MNILKYDTPFQDFKSYKSAPVVFLAGPTVRGNQPHLTSWRIAACEEFEKQKFEGTLILPEFQDKTESDQYRYDSPEWEFNGLTVADCIMFWIPRTRELIGLTTNFEIGYWLARNPLKCVYGRPDDAYRMKYVDIMWDLEHKRDGGYNHDYEIRSSLEETVKKAIETAQYRYDGENSVQTFLNYLNK